MTTKETKAGERTVKAWAVVWVADPFEFRNPGEIVVATTKEEVVDKDLQIDFPLFASKRAAEEFRDKVEDWKTVKATITYSLT